MQGLKMRYAAVGAALVLAAGASPGGAQDAAGPRVLSARDTLRIDQVGDPALSPDGEWVVYTLRSHDMDDPDLEAVTQLWRVRVDGTGNRQLTRGASGATAPAWSPDGAVVAFLAARGDEENAKAQVHFLPADGGEAWQVTGHDEAVGWFSFAPDGSGILFTASDSLPEAEEERRKEEGDAEIVDASFQMTHLWLHDLETSRTRRLTGGDFTVANADWSPDSRQVAFEARPNPTANDSWRSDIRVVDVASGEQRLLHENGGSDTSPRWSPDGRTVAFASNPSPSANSLHDRLTLADAVGETARVLLAEHDRNFTTPIWSVNGAHVFWATGDGTSTRLFRVGVESGAVTTASAPGGAQQRVVALRRRNPLGVGAHRPRLAGGDLYGDRRRRAGQTHRRECLAAGRGRAARCGGDRALDEQRRRCRRRGAHESRWATRRAAPTRSSSIPTADPRRRRSRPSTPPRSSSPATATWCSSRISGAARTTARRSSAPTSTTGASPTTTTS